MIQIPMLRRSPTIACTEPTASGRRRQMQLSIVSLALPAVSSAPSSVSNQTSRRDIDRSGDMTGELTFREIEASRGILFGGETGDSFLNEWYQTVRDRPLGQFSNKDFGIACRQRLYLECVVPVLLSHLELEPLAGDMYDGELLTAIAVLPREFWLNNGEFASMLRTFLDSVAIETDDGDVMAALRHLRSLSACGGPGLADS